MVLEAHQTANFVRWRFNVAGYSTAVATSSITASRLTKFQVFGIQKFSGCAPASLIQAIDNPDNLLPDAT
ncbi:hypothetical protein M378DRAFT_164886 [Amanita muscaria Koide BX008]|uniref:Uncharacterized protein n=1 Tax=Amanita muscaria (strain Koide BX008) TaxID=946122 RepID=A0A0C2X205_AMAMK|nr:hypothetical protein M378DRAFT_164886 [Amanita muscaria Koide BX008]